MILCNMSRKKLLILIIFITIIIGIVAIFMNYSIKFEKLQIDQTQWESIVSKRKENDNAKIEKIEFNGYSLIIDEEEDKIYSKEALVANVNLLAIDTIEKPISVDIKTRYSARSAKGTISQLRDEDGNFIDKILIEFDEPQPRITPGQSAVFYIDDVVIGGGIFSNKNS